METLAHVGGSRWRIETEFETEKSDIGLDEYETRSWAGWHHHVALCLLGGAFLLGLQQDWGKRCFSAAARRFSWERFARSFAPRAGRFHDLDETRPVMPATLL